MQKKEFSRSLHASSWNGPADVFPRQPGHHRADMVLFAHMILMDSDAGAAMKRDFVGELMRLGYERRSSP